MKNLRLKFSILVSIISLFFFNGCTKPQEACFIFTPLNSTDIVFDASCSQNTSTYQWTFGDGTSDSTTTISTITHTFNTPGSYTVVLNAERKDGVALSEGTPTISTTITIQ